MRGIKTMWPRGFASHETLERACMRSLLASSGERVFFKDLDGRFLLASASWLAAEGRGLSLAEVIGKTDLDIFSEPRASAAMEDERRIIVTGEPIVAKVERETFDDRPDAWVSTTRMPLLDDRGEVIGTFGIARDITAQVEAQRELSHQALHDPLTELANRVALMDRLDQALVSLERRPGHLAVLFLDLDDFKGINDNLGHHVGDRVLVEVGRRLRQAARRCDTVARFGGDEFVLLCTGLRNDCDLEVIGERVMRAIAVPFEIDRGTLAITGSLGAVASSDPHANASELLQQADAAMYAAKRGGRGRFQIYTAELHERSETSRSFAADLLRAIERSELFLLYQPLICLQDGLPSGVEALVRWRHPEHGVMLPEEFVSAAERLGVSAAIDAFVLDEACRQLAEWSHNDRSLQRLTISVNISGRQLRDPGLPALVAATLDRHDIAPARLCIEVAESELIGELGDAHEAIAAISQLGVRIAVDDFGTGHATLAALHNLRADVLKIDRSCIAQLRPDSRERELVVAAIAFARALGMTVVAEGVETDAEREELTALGCESAQGYLLAPPLAAAEVVALPSMRNVQPAGGVRAAA
jgi:diguanylate cyclase (GGDEF)-like protein/PAS domain S-box-containing protein